MRTMTEQFNAALKWELAWALQATPHTLGDSLQALYMCGKCPRFPSQGTTKVFGYFKQGKLLFCQFRNPFYCQSADKPTQIPSRWRPPS